jgi:hypothetical protein
MTMCTISAFSLIVAVRALWSPKWAQSRLFDNPNAEKPAAQSE